ncbi:GTPase [Candidatus Carsonella ruddii]|uniref:Putative GTPase n=1 Tax=Candidatus Carsonella ruddii HC isolate Thao2000 TaxID=1202538 RepID=J3YQ59_CARRU|nr:GTPase [Candidatus Carsonella ruddii]AFP83998.1 putative GTPase [Candidatus Carsonella ruddii HC isolate Thao2000]
MFISKKILLKSGNGGNGNISYLILNNKFYANGGNGGNGGDVYLFFNNNFKLLNINLYIAKNGLNGKNKLKKGKKGEDAILNFPIGGYLEYCKKKIYIVKNNYFIKILKGGKGGLGNYFYKNFYNSKIANYGQKGKIIFIKFCFFFFLKKCFININFNFFNINNFFYKNNFISKIYIFFINLLFFKILFKIIKFFLYFLYLKNFNYNNYWLIIDGIENINFLKIIKIKLLNTIYFLLSSIFYIGVKKFFHYIKLWKNS